MREKDEREWVEKKGRKGNGNYGGYVHRLDQVATSFFVTNFPDECKAVDLWPKFAHFGRVGEVYIPEKRDKQGRRFGFVKFRDVRDAEEQLKLLSDIWIGTYKLRVNLARFSKGSTEKEGIGDKGKMVMGQTTEGKSKVETGRSFREALVDRPVELKIANNKGGSVEAGVSSEVVWEVEVEAEALAKLKGAFVGFLSEPKDHMAI
jgi:RNA recognition motif-containing protein